MVRKFLPRREIKLDEEKFFLVFENACKLILVNSSLRNYENGRKIVIEKLFCGRNFSQQNFENSFLSFKNGE